MEAENIVLNSCIGSTYPEAPALNRLHKAQTLRKRKAPQLLKYLGPAFIVSVAYIDPGNFATNISGGSMFGYSLIWVILWSNLIAIFLQILSAKLGIATGKNLPQLCGLVYGKTANRVFWLIAELGAMATNIAEFLGAALGLYLLFHIPMIYAGLICAVLTFLVCSLEKYGQKYIEAAITVLVAVISGAYLIEVFLARPDWTMVGLHTLIPSLPDGGAMVIAVGMLGATVMPHVIYLHSQLVQYRRGDNSEEAKKHHLKMEKIDIIIAMNIAFLINAAMVIVSSAVFNKSGISVDTIEKAHMSLKPLLGSLSSGAFGIALLASGLSSSAVGTMSGQSVMKGFMRSDKSRLPDSLLRLITMLPAIVIIILGINPMRVLVLSQVVLSFILPVPIIQLLHISGKEKYMGSFKNNRRVKAAGIVIASVIIILNAVLLLITFLGIN